MKAFVFLAVLLQASHLIFSQSGVNRCNNIKKDTCWFCIQEPGCAWCSDEGFVGRRCDTPSNHLQNNCPSNHTINPSANKTFPDLKVVGPNNQLSPRKVNLTLRVGEPFSFKVNVRPAKDYPVDLYYLMDLSRSMEDDLNTLKLLAGNISKKLNELTSKHRLAFGSYVDKVIMPYVKQQNIGVAYCFTDTDHTRKCGDKPYDYKHILDFTSDAAAFKKKIGETTFSGNRDIPEGMLDALMQIAACEKELQWNSKSSTRRMVLIATDALFHFAGEGKFAGIVEPNDQKCHLKADGTVQLYDKSLELDYPSVSQVYKKLKETGIQPIFAVGNEAAYAPYQSLVSTWSDLSATFGQLGERSENITDLIEKSYKAIVSTVLLTPNAPDDVKLEITPNCGPKAKSFQRSCTGVSPGDDVSFDVSVTVDSCAKGNSTKFSLVSTGFGEVEVNINILCRCDCQSVQVPNSPKCNGNGTLVCGSCDCDPGWQGADCQCDSTKRPESGAGDVACKKTNTSDIICEGNGECSCGECQCKLIGNKGKRYYGKFCQCSDFNCEQYENKLCGGDRGECKCGQCNCNKGFIGSNCGNIDCSLEVKRCLVNGVNCSDNGECDCGKCKCKPFYQGTHCKDCPSCAGKCDDYKVCALCGVFGYVPANKTECEDCPDVVKLGSVAEMENLGYPTVCTYTDEDGCTYRFTYGSQEGKNATIFAVTVKDCPEGPDVLLIVLAVIGGIVGIGILLLILWKLLTAMVDRREYEKFEKDRAKSKWHREKNPLYQPATSTVQNPTFVGSQN